MPSTDSKIRNNKQIWKMAEYLFDGFSDYFWDNQPQEDKNWYYDHVSIFLKKQANNEFTGEDNHD